MNRSARMLIPALAYLIANGSPCLGEPPTTTKVKVKSTANQAPAAPVKVTSVEGITEYQLVNGLRVLLFPDASKPTITANITYLVGSRHENYGETGMAHLLEHLCFKGTPKNPDIPKVLSSLGARFNGSTWLDRTNYFISFPATDDNLNTILEMEADRMVNCFVGVDTKKAAEQLKTEMTVVRNEFEAGENDPLSVTLQRTTSAAFDWHNYGKSTIGCKADIENVNIERLSAFYKKYYQPDNAVLLLAGKFEEAKALGLVNRYFGALPKPTRAIEPTYTQDPAQDGERAVTVRRVGDTPALVTAYRVPAGTDEGSAAIQVLSRIMTTQPSGRLYKALVETKKAAFVFPMVYPTHEPGLAMFAAMLPKEGKLEEAREAMLGALEGVAREPISQVEVDRAKQEILKQVELTLNESDRLGIGMSESIAQGDWRLFFLNRDRVKAVTPEAVQKAAATYFQQSNRTVGSFVPTEKPARVEMPTLVRAAGLVKDYKGQAVVAQGEAFDAAPAAIEARVQRFTTEAGLKVALLPKKTRGESVSATLTLRFGDVKSLEGKDAAGELCASMLMRGTAKHSRQELKDAFDRLKANVGVFGGSESARVMVTTVRANLPEVLTLVAEVLREPAFPQKEFETLVQEEITGIESQKKEPTAIASNILQQHVNPYPKGHPRRVTSYDEYIAELKATRVEDARAFHAGFYGASNGELAIVGDFDAGAMKTQLQSLIGTWKATQPFTRIPAQYFNVPAINQAIETPDKANAFFVANLNLQVMDTDPDYPALYLGNYLLGGGGMKSRLWERIRQKEGLSYGVGSFVNANAFDRAGSFGAYAIYNPANLAKLEIAFQEEVGKALRDGFTEQELQDAKKAFQQSRDVSRAQDRELANKLTSHLFTGRTMASDATFEKQVAALTNAQIVAALNKHLDPARISIVKAGDFAKTKAAAEKK